MTKPFPFFIRRMDMAGGLAPACFNTAAPVAAVDAGTQANHRGTFLYGLRDQKERFNAMLAADRQ